MRSTLASSTALSLFLALSHPTGSLAQLGGLGGTLGQGPASAGMMGDQRQPQLTEKKQLRWSMPSNTTGSPGTGNRSWSVVNFLASIDDASRNSGMTLAPADPALRAHLGLGKGEGLIVTAIDPGCPAAAAGIQQNDLLLRLGEEAPRSMALGKPDDLEAGLKAVGEHAVSLSLYRGGRKIQVKVQPRLRASLGPVPPAPPAPPAPTYRIGVQVATIEPALRSQLQIPPDQGLIIMEVFENTPAARAGLQANDIILKIDDVPLSSQGDLGNHVQSRAEKPMKVELLRQGRKQEIQITAERVKDPVAYHAPVSTTTQFDVVLPGAVLAAREGSQDATELALKILELRNLQDLIEERYHRAGNPAGANAPQAGATAVAAPGEKSTDERLEQLSVQIRELRRAVEAMAKAQEKK